MIFVNHIKQITKKLLFSILLLNLLSSAQDTYINTDKIIPSMNLLHRVVDPLEILPIKRNHIYRKNVNWSKLEENYKTYIDCGGKAIWQFIVFEHNKHQLSQAKKISKIEKFFAFNEKYSERVNHEVVEIKKKNIEHDFIKCKATYFNKELEKSFFIDVNGTVWPCCWMGSSTYTQKFHDFFGHCLLENNLNYSDFDEIVKSELYSKLWNNLKLMEICNIKCKRNETDEDNWKIN